MTRKLFAILFALAILAIAMTPARADLETCIPVLEAWDAHSDAIGPAKAAYSRAEAKARSIRDKEKGDAAVARDRLRIDALGGSNWYYDTEAGIEAQAAYDKAVGSANATYRNAVAMAQAELRNAEDEANATLALVVREAWNGPTSDNPKVMAAILSQFLRDCISRFASDLN